MSSKNSYHNSLFHDFADTLPITIDSVKKLHFTWYCLIADNHNMDVLKKPTLYKFLALLSYVCGLILFAYSLMLPALITDTKPIYGYWLLIFGPLGLLFFQIGWFGNFLSLLSMLISNRKPRIAFLLSILAILIASQAFLLDEIPFAKPTNVTGFHDGFYLWYSSHYIVAFGTLLQLVAWWLATEVEAEPETIPASSILLTTQTTVETEKPHHVTVTLKQK